MDGDVRPSNPAVVAAGSSTRVAERRDGDGRRRLDEIVAEEVPIALVVNRNAFAVMMASPADLEDFARGFALTEGIVEAIAECEAVEVEKVARGWEVRLTVSEARGLALRARTRALAGRTGCGLCGVDTIAEAMRPVSRPTTTARFSADAIHRAVDGFGADLPLNRATGATHAAAFADAAGRIVMVREDVGRHNAVDKLVGGLAAVGVDAATGFVVVSSRCSYEMVHKVAAAGCGAIVSVSAPTGLAIDLAEKLGVGLAAFARDARFTVYAASDRFE